MKSDDLIRNYKLRYGAAHLLNSCEVACSDKLCYGAAQLLKLRVEDDLAAHHFVVGQHWRAFQHMQVSRDCRFGRVTLCNFCSACRCLATRALFDQYSIGRDP